MISMNHLNFEQQQHRGRNQVPLGAPPGLEVPPAGAAEAFAPATQTNQNIAVENARLNYENARLNYENALMRLQAQSMPQMPMPYAASPYGPFPPYAGMQSPWEMPYAGAQPFNHQGYMHACHGARAIAKKPVGKQKAMDLASNAPTASTSSGEWTLGSKSTASGESDEEDTSASAQPPTTVMLRNLPNNMTGEQLIELIDQKGFKDCYNLVYLPMDFKTKVGLGYAFVDLITNQDAHAFSKLFHGFSDWLMSSEKVCEVTWSSLQGIDAHVERYRNSPVMHESVPDDFRPVLLKDGERVPFPKPTKMVRAPRQWSRRHS